MTQELLEQQEIKLPLTELHNEFGVCFDKKDTYTITELDREDFKGAITINNVIKTAGIDLSKDTEVVILFSYERKYFDDINVCSFNINKEKKTVNNYRGVYRKSDITAELKEAIKIVVIEATKGSLKFPRYDTCRDLNFYESKKFNGDFTLTERVKFAKGHNYIYKWDEEAKESLKVQMTDEEIRDKGTNRDIYVQFLSGKILGLQMTWGSDNGETWGDVIDKSGYNVKAKRINLSFKLGAYKANKVKKKIKGGDLISTQGDIVNKIRDCKVYIGNSLLSCSSNLSNLKEEVEATECTLGRLRRIIRDFELVNNHINEAIAGNDYEGHTLSIEDDLKMIDNKLDEILKEIR